MRFENIVKKLQKEGYIVELMQFNFKECFGVNGTALIDVVNGDVTETSARYKDVIKQIEEGKSHIYNIEIINGCNKKSLSPYRKLG